MMHELAMMALAKPAAAPAADKFCPIALELARKFSYSNRFSAPLTTRVVASSHKEAATSSTQREAPLHSLCRQYDTLHSYGNERGLRFTQSQRQEVTQAR